MPVALAKQNTDEPERGSGPVRPVCHLPTTDALGVVGHGSGRIAADPGTTPCRVHESAMRGDHEGRDAVLKNRPSWKCVLLAARRLNPACTDSHFPPVKNSNAERADHSDVNVGIAGASSLGALMGDASL